MRPSFSALVALALLTPLPAEAGCSWTPSNNIQCTSNCWVTDHWVDANGQPWMKWSCSGGSDGAFGLLLLVGLVLAIAGACGAFSSAPVDPFEEENKKIAAQLEEMKALEAKLTAAAAEADDYLNKK